MQARTQEAISYLDRNRVALEQAVDAVPDSLRGRRPAPDRWSVADVLEHLTLVEGRVTKLLGTHVAAAREAGLGAESDASPVLPAMNVATIIDRSEPIVAREGSLPKGAQDASAALTALVAQRKLLTEFIESVDGLALSDVMVPHPRLGQLNVYQWLIFLAAHEARHTEQIRETAKVLGA